MVSEEHLPKSDFLRHSKEQTQEQNKDSGLAEKPQKQQKQEKMILIIVGAVIGFIVGVFSIGLVSDARHYLDDTDEGKE